MHFNVQSCSWMNDSRRPDHDFLCRILMELGGDGEGFIYIIKCGRGLRNWKLDFFSGAYWRFPCLKWEINMFSKSHEFPRILFKDQQRFSFEFSKKLQQHLIILENFFQFPRIKFNFHQFQQIQYQNWKSVDGTIITNNSLCQILLIGREYNQSSTDSKTADCMWIERKKLLFLWLD